MHETNDDGAWHPKTADALSRVGDASFEADLVEAKLMNILEGEYIKLKSEYDDAMEFLDKKGVLRGNGEDSFTLTGRIQGIFLKMEEQVVLEIGLIQAYTSLADALQWTRYLKPNLNQIDLPRAVRAAVDFINESKNIVEESQRVVLSQAEEIKSLNNKLSAALSYASLLDDHGPDGRNVRNQDYVKLLSENDQLKDSLRMLEARVMENSQNLQTMINRNTRLRASSWAEASDKLSQELEDAGIDPFSEPVLAGEQAHPPYVKQEEKREEETELVENFSKKEETGMDSKHLKDKEESPENFLKGWEKWVSETATYFDCGGGDITYPLLGLVGELGELVNSIVKYYRKADLITLKIQHLPPDLRQKLKDESYDALHFLMFLLNEQGISLEEIINYGRKKLEKRMEEGTIHKENRISGSLVGKKIRIIRFCHETGRPLPAQEVYVYRESVHFVTLKSDTPIRPFHGKFKIEIVGDFEHKVGRKHISELSRNKFYEALK